MADYTGTFEANALTGSALADEITGLGGDDTLFGGDGNDTLYGGEDNDLLYGGAGRNILDGGTGNDTYVIESAADRVTEEASGGTDTVQTSVPHFLDANVENLTLTGSAAVYGGGNDLDNVLTGNLANNWLYAGGGQDWLDGGAGNDTLIGGTGNDTYVVDSNGDFIGENADEGIDTVQSSVDYTLGDNVENLTLTGNDSLSGTANGLDNVLTGNAAANALYGAGGNDTLSGGDEQDTLYGGDGYDVLYGGDGADSLSGGDGGGAFFSGLGNDTIDAGTGGSRVEGEEGDDLIFTGVMANDAILFFLGGDGEDTLSANSGSLVMLHGQDGNDHIEGLGANNFTIRQLYGGAGNDTISTETGKRNELYGGTGEDQLFGSAVYDTLDGGAGNDTMQGGGGDDTYIVDSAGDELSELTAQNTDAGGKDTVESSVSYVLGDYFENLTLTGDESLSGTGNALENLLTGNSAANTLSGGGGNDTLDGAGGNDTLMGGIGNDTYVAVSLGDDLRESFGEGIDTVQTAIDYTLGDNLENLTLTGRDSLSGTGNALDNVLTGNSGANRLEGGGGSDRIYGRQGADSLDGGIGVDRLYGGFGKDTLLGGAERDSLMGGAGNDTYILSDAQTVVVEGRHKGSDLVIASVTYHLTRNVENLTLTGDGLVNGFGNAARNLLIGNESANRLYGGGSDDQLSGRNGDDWLYGGGGDDSLSGGSGKDHFVFTTKGSVDTITDFASGTDRIDLARSVFEGLGTKGVLKEAAFYAASGATSGHDQGDRIVYDTATGALYFDADGIGGTSAVQIALLEGHPTLTYQDIFIV